MNLSIVRQRVLLVCEKIVIAVASLLVNKDLLRPHVYYAGVSSAKIVNYTMYIGHQL